MVAFAVSLREGAIGWEVLLVRTSSGRRWIFPKGSVEKGESIETAAARELAEESGWRVGGLAEGALVSSWEGERAVYVLFPGAEASGKGESGRAPAWFPVISADILLRSNRTPEAAAPLIVALRWAVRRAAAGGTGQEG